MRYAVKVKTTDSKRYEFLSSDGTLVHIRVHAGTSDDLAKCEGVVFRLKNNYDDVADAKVVTFGE